MSDDDAVVVVNVDELKAALTTLDPNLLASDCFLRIWIPHVMLEYNDAMQVRISIMCSISRRCQYGCCAAAILYSSAQPWANDDSSCTVQ